MIGEKMDRKERYLNVRLYQPEHSVLELMAAREGLKMSEMMRELIREGAKNRGIHDIGILDFTSERRQDIQQPA
jgi:hypothetical protein